MAFTGNYTCDSYVAGLPKADFDFGTGTTDVFKLALYTNSATLNASTAVYTATGEVVASGYTAGGSILTPTQAFSDGVAYTTFANVSWTASFTARGALIYKVGGTVAMFVLDFGSDKTSTATFQVQFPTASSTTAIIRLST
ncbi:hypothetical protein UFOVP1295_62 [uncultured Caudovirales phage]|uniref:Uncharacterized protein n=1 Tax=uncultured Caudovirales phage TaxID=2100421 RepID=A0A6J5RRC8_9CAUD|nr:hypothetical protein UFOVP1295_62 [uncultured Caudovirales phage]